MIYRTARLPKASGLNQPIFLLVDPAAASGVADSFASYEVVDARDRATLAHLKSPSGVEIDLNGPRHGAPVHSETPVRAREKPISKTQKIIQIIDMPHPRGCRRRWALSAHRWGADLAAASGVAVSVASYEVVYARGRVENR